MGSHWGMLRGRMMLFDLRFNTSLWLLGRVYPRGRTRTGAAGPALATLRAGDGGFAQGRWQGRLREGVTCIHCEGRDGRVPDRLHVSCERECRRGWTATV